MKMFKARFLYNDIIEMDVENTTEKCVYFKHDGKIIRVSRNTQYEVWCKSYIDAYAAIYKHITDNIKSAKDRVEYYKNKLKEFEAKNNNPK